MKVRWYSVALIAAGFGLGRVEHAFDVRGDLARAVGRTGDALANHSIALLFNLTSLACFVIALVSIWRGWRGRGGASATQSIAPAVAEEPAFDPDAMMARYLTQREAAPPAPPAGGFGRKGR